MKKFIKKRWQRVLIVFLVIWIPMFVTDFIRFNNMERPVFAIPLVAFRDGGSATYFGLGYTIDVRIWRDDLDPRWREVKRIQMAPWFWPLMRVGGSK